MGIALTRSSTTTRTSRGTGGSTRSTPRSSSSSRRLLDLPGSPVASITSCVPLREADGAAERRCPLDPRIRVVGTRAVRRHRGLPAPPARRCFGPTGRSCDGPSATADLALAQGAGLERGAGRGDRGPGRRAALRLGRRAVRRRWPAPGSAGWPRRGARPSGSATTLVGRLAGVGGHRLVVGDGVVDGDGIVASLVEPAELRDPAERPWPPVPDRRRRPARLGRAPGRGQGARGAARRGRRRTGRSSSRSSATGRTAERLVELASTLGVGDRIHWSGHVADRATYLDRLAAADAFVFPSPAEGFPKVVLDAFAVGLPVLATPVGAVGASSSRPGSSSRSLAPTPTTSSSRLATTAARRIAAHAEDRRRRGPRLRRGPYAGRPRPPGSSSAGATWWPTCRGNAERVRSARARRDRRSGFRRRTRLGLRRLPRRVAAAGADPAGRHAAHERRPDA